MPRFSTRSKGKLETCIGALQQLMDAVVERYDCTILEGHRSPERQLELYNAKPPRTKVRFGKHNTDPSEAVDAAPWIPGRRVPWPKAPGFLARLSGAERSQLSAYVKDMAQFYHFAGYVEGTADAMEIPIRWGGDWDRDHCLSDQTFDDLVHFEVHRDSTAVPAQAV